MEKGSKIKERKGKQMLKRYKEPGRLGNRKRKYLNSKSKQRRKESEDLRKELNSFGRIKPLGKIMPKIFTVNWGRKGSM